ncbi:transposase-like zinc-binding domain-containing protein [Anabaena sp. UHCC 0399]|uniref:IS1/IS1595 family N-terminal zinc-binding domain-containing protein n=1 Tax=Anabaena sp. UHCC 0399 TaxID=3110238 RepID=UPI003A4C6C7E
MNGNKDKPVGSCSRCNDGKVEFLAGLVSYLPAPFVHLRQTVKNGRIHNGKQRFKCHNCRWHFVLAPTKKVIDRFS